MPLLQLYIYCKVLPPITETKSARKPTREWETHIRECLCALDLWLYQQAYRQASTVMVTIKVRYRVLKQDRVDRSKCMTVYMHYCLPISQMSFCFKLTIICLEVKHSHAHTRSQYIHMLRSQTQLGMHTHVLNTCNHTGERPQGCQAREHAWRQLLKLVAVKDQVPATKKLGENRQCAQLPRLGCCVVGMHGVV